jgi:LuxR family maltose regulon positive regulatory protein
VDDDLSYLHEFEHLTLAKALVTHYTAEGVEDSVHQAVGLLQRLLQAAEEGKRRGSVLEILVLTAIAHQIIGDTAAALVPLERALNLAEPEGYVRLFVDEGAAMASLLEAAAERGIAPGYARRLLRAFGNIEESTTATQRLIEPLSERERDVLRLLASDLGGPDIARELVVSLNTVRTHTKNIYAKLGVNNRRAAVRRAEELDLMRSHRSAKQSPS